MTLLGVCCVALVLAVAYPFSLQAPHAATPPEEQFRVDEPTTYNATGRIVADGDTALAVTAIRTTDGSRYQRIREPGVVAETYQADANATAYERIRVAAPDHAASLRADIQDDPDRRLRRSERADGWTTFVVAEPDARPLDPITGGPSVVVRSLHIAAYDRTNRTETDATYTPEAGWYDGRTGYRLTDATGTVRTAGETTAVVTANVSWTLTERADTYAAYALARLTGEGTTHQRLTVAVDDPERVERPAWVPAE